MLWRQKSKVRRSLRGSTYVQRASLFASYYSRRGTHVHLVCCCWCCIGAAGGQKSWEQIERELLNGQKLQGVLTSHEVQAVLKNKGWEHHFPLFTTINRVVKGDIAPHRVVEFATRP